MDGKTRSLGNSVVDQKNIILFIDETGNNIGFDDLPETDREQSEDEIKRRDDALTITGSTSVVDTPLAGVNDAAEALPLTKLIQLLEKLRESLNAGLIEAEVYERMVSDFIKDYILAMDESTRLKFVADRMVDSGRSDFLSQDMRNELNATVVSTKDL